MIYSIYAVDVTRLVARISGRGRGERNGAGGCKTKKLEDLLKSEQL